MPRKATAERKKDAQTTVFKIASKRLLGECDLEIGSMYVRTLHARPVMQNFLLHWKTSLDRMARLQLLLTVTLKKVFLEAVGALQDVGRPGRKHSL